MPAEQHEAMCSEADKLGDKLRALGFPESDVLAAGLQMGIEYGFAYAFDYKSQTPQVIADRILGLMIERRAEERKEVS